MSNLPDNISPSNPNAPWNKRRSTDDIEDEVEQLRSLRDYTEKLALELDLTDTADELFATSRLQQYDCSNPVDMLETMLAIIKDRLALLAQLP
jgi:hypothetical protein